jgi:hypothetical protein
VTVLKLIFTILCRAADSGQPQDPCLYGVTSRDATGRPLSWTPRLQGAFVSQQTGSMRGKIFRILPRNQLLNRTLTWGKDEGIVWLFIP